MGPAPAAGADSTCKPPAPARASRGTDAPVAWAASVSNKPGMGMGTQAPRSALITTGTPSPLEWTPGSL